MVYGGRHASSPLRCLSAMLPFEGKDADPVYPNELRTLGDEASADDRLAEGSGGQVEAWDDSEGLS
jgi:hypothetical protein